jgi:hypothetical protein
MATPDESLRKLIQAARKAPAPAPPPADSPAPFGFSMRVASHWGMSRGPSSLADAWERLSWWGAGASVALCLLVFVGQSLRPEANPFDELMETQAEAGEVLDMI